MKNRILNGFKHFFTVNKKSILVWFLITILIGAGIYLHIDKGIITVIVMVFGIVGNAYAGLAALISIIPIIGPLIVKVLSLPLFWLLNSTGYFVSAVAIKRGHKKEILNYRVITIIFLIGFAVGFIIAKLI